MVEWDKGSAPDPRTIRTHDDITHDLIAHYGSIEAYLEQVRRDSAKQDQARLKKLAAQRWLFFIVGFVLAVLLAILATHRSWGGGLNPLAPSN